ncbi:MAG: hypothetical protein F2799_03020 [Actinobacteria bacterium]|uniref:Unannotated protein n=1 Tax=freshwater metagenome TaxID=449393 RepID=A0A6J7DGJ7_9ZZZZ|nr:hypothetical protein [Actinomycetota bacterium]
MQLRSTFATTTAALLVGLVVAASPAAAAQNYAPDCSGKATVTNVSTYELTYEITCNDFTTTYVDGADVTKTVTYPGAVNGYSIFSVTRNIVGFDTEPFVLNPDGSSAASSFQTISCNGEIPSNAIGCSLSSATSLYTRAGAGTDISPYAYSAATVSGLFAKPGSDYVALTELFPSDKLFPANSGKKIIPAKAGNKITGTIHVDANPCKALLQLPKLMANVSDGEGQQGVPFNLSVASSTKVKLTPGGKGITLAHGCPYVLKKKTYHAS